MKDDFDLHPLDVSIERQRQRGIAKAASNAEKKVRNDRIKVKNTKYSQNRLTKARHKQYYGRTISVLALIFIVAFISTVAGSIIPEEVEVIVGDKTFTYWRFEPNNAIKVGNTAITFVSDILTSIGGVGDSFRQFLVAGDGSFNAAIINTFGDIISFLLDSMSYAVEIMLWFLNIVDEDHNLTDTDPYPWGPPEDFVSYVVYSNVLQKKPSYFSLHTSECSVVFKANSPLYYWSCYCPPACPAYARYLEEDN